MRTRVKICGITRLEDALKAVSAGADAIGLVFYPPSPRYLSPEQAKEIVRRLPPFVTVTGLFVDAPAEDVLRIARQCSLDLLQFHGDETPEYCEQFARPFMKALRMKPGIDLLQESSRFAGARALLLDTYRSGVPGGTGETFDWTRVPEALAGRIVLAGGLNCDNVTEAIRRLRPFAVDVSGGVEREKGIKDGDRIEAFMRGVERADREND